MTTMIHLKTGEVIPCFGDEEIQLRRIIEERLGDDAAKTFDDVIDQCCHSNKDDEFLLDDIDRLQNQREEIRDALEDACQTLHETATMFRLENEIDADYIEEQAMILSQLC